MKVCILLKHTILATVEFIACVQAAEKPTTQPVCSACCSTLTHCLHRLPSFTTWGQVGTQSALGLGLGTGSEGGCSEAEHTAGSGPSVTAAGEQGSWPGVSCPSALAHCPAARPGLPAAREWAVLLGGRIKHRTPGTLQHEGLH